MDSIFCKCVVTVSICKVGDCGLRTYQTITTLMRVTALYFTNITPILYIHCCKAYSISKRIFINIFSYCRTIKITHRHV
jgi:hypothetical protein